MGGAKAARYDVAEKDIATLQADLSAGRVTSEDLVRAYLARIDRLDRRGPRLQSVIAINPNALADARALDSERRAKGARGPLHGIPILVKDNIETADPIATTAGSLALKDNITHRDSPAVARLRGAGVIILGKTNLSEWANIRSSRSISGWSAIGGLTRNPYVLDRSACGSSSGSGSAVAASLAAAALGSETDGSLVCPGSINGVVALKPTVGLVSRTHIIPISHSQDTAGPMARSVADVALLVSVMAATDPDDPATAEADAHKSDYANQFDSASLTGKRLGVIVPDAGTVPSETDAVFAEAVAALKAQGATIVEIRELAPPPPDIGTTELTVLEFELRHDLNAYLASLPPGQKIKTLADAIDFNDATPRETALFGQDIFTKAQSLGDLTDPAYVKARDDLKKYSRSLLDKLFTENHLDALIRSTDDASFRIDIVKGDNDTSNSSFLPATAGYPHLTVPMGLVRGLPVGLSFIGPAWSEASLLALGHAFEQATHARKPPAFLPSLEAEPDVAKAFEPQAR
ncbi:MAG TPA: amidase [Rhizomicrobium sp.]|nr:amidase [Rhizomicrobium sp.]